MTFNGSTDLILRLRVVFSIFCCILPWMICTCTAGTTDSKAGVCETEFLLRCGPVALQLCSELYGRTLYPKHVEKHFAFSSDENTLAEIDNAAHAVGLRTLAVIWHTSLPPPGAPPAIIPIVNARGRRHFITMAACKNNNVLVVDVPRRPIWISEEQLRSKLRWQGEALHVATTDDALAEIRRRVNSNERYRMVAPWLAAIVVGAALLTLKHFRRRRSSDCVACETA